SRRTCSISPATTAVCKLAVATSGYCSRMVFARCHFFGPSFAPNQQDRSRNSSTRLWLPSRLSSRSSRCALRSAQLRKPCSRASACCTSRSAGGDEWCGTLCASHASAAGSPARIALSSRFARLRSSARRADDGCRAMGTSFRCKLPEVRWCTGTMYRARSMHGPGFEQTKTGLGSRQSIPGLFLRQIRGEIVELGVRDLGLTERRHRQDALAHECLDRLGGEVGAFHQHGRYAAVVLQLQRLSAGVTGPLRVARCAPVLVDRLAALEVRRVLGRCGRRRQ